LLSIGGSALRRPSSIRIETDPRQTSLKVKERWLGIPLRSHELALDEVKDVKVERGTYTPFARTARMPPIVAGRLLVVDRKGRTPLTELLLPGDYVHDLAAGSLRAILLGEPEPEPAMAPQVAGASAAKRWYSHPILKLLAAVIILGGAGQAALMWYAGQTQGFLEVTCSHRCRMGGAECLPGGAWSGSFDEGNYTIEVWNPAEADHWEARVVHVTKGATTHFTCEPAPSGR
jgi:hypothetical protein